MSSNSRLANPIAAARTVLLLSIAAAASAVVIALTKKRRHATDIALPKSVVNNTIKSSTRILLAIDIGSSSVRCSAYTVSSPPVLIPGCAFQIKYAIVTEASGMADAEQVVDLVDEAVDRCFSALRARGISRSVIAVGFACFGMNLVGVDADGRPCTPVYTYASACPESAEVVKRLRESLERTGSGGTAGVEEARQRTGTPTHVSYAPVQLLRWLARTAGEGGTDATRRVKTWQTLPSLIAARWCRLTSAPVSYSEASWMGLLDFRRLKWDAPTLSVLEQAGFDPSTLPRLTDVGGLRAGASGYALVRWPELDGASIRLGLGDGAAACLGSGCDETSGLVAVTVGTSAAARVVLRIPATAPASLDDRGRSARDRPEKQKERGSGGGGDNVEASMATAGVAGVAAGSGDGTCTPVTDSKAFCVPEGLWCYRLDRHRAVLGGSLTDGGSVFSWLCDTLALVPGKDMDATMREAEALPPAGHGLVILPFLSGERSPGYNDAARACILGLRRSTTRAHLMRAGLESVCLRLAAIVDLMSGGGSDGGGDGDGGIDCRYDGSRPKPDRNEVGGASKSAGDSAGVGVVATSPREGEGGNSTVFCPALRRDAGVVTSGHAMAASPFWRQILADSLGRPVRGSGATEETSLGVAILVASLEGNPGREGTGGEEAGVAAGAGAGTQADSGSTRENPTADVSKPSDVAFQAYRDAGLAQKRAYRTIFGNSASLDGGCPGHSRLP